MSTLPAADRALLPVEDARQRMIDAVPVLDDAETEIRAALGQVLAENIVADIDMPPFDNTAMDGYAVRAADIVAASPAAPVSLRVIEHLPAGSVPACAVGAGEATRIMTGAPMPEGADAVVMVEDTDGDTEIVRILQPSAAGAHIRRRGESVERGAIVLPRGTLVRAGEIGMMASLGRTHVRAVRRPRVALVSTGDELVPPDRMPGPGQIRDSNRYGIYGQVAAMGAEPVDIGLLPDDADAIRAGLERALDAGDCVVTSGGVSVGDYDLTKQILAELGEIRFWRVAMKPGKPQAFGMARGKPVFGLPGNPVSSMVVFDQFVRPAILKMAGHTRLFRPRLKATLIDDIRKPAGKVHFMRVVIEENDGELTARLAGAQGSGILRSMTRANGLAIVGLDVTHLAAGEQVDVELWD